MVEGVELSCLNFLGLGASGKKGYRKILLRKLIFTQKFYKKIKRLILIHGKRGNTLIKQDLENSLPVQGQPQSHSFGWGQSHS